MKCTHERWEQIAAADGGDPGGCPICMSAEIDEQRSEIEHLRHVIQQVLTDMSDLVMPQYAAEYWQERAEALRAALAAAGGE